MADEEETRTVLGDVTEVVEELFNGQPEEEVVEEEKPLDAAPEEEVAEETEEPTEEVEEEAPKELQPPEHYSAEDKEKFLAIPNEYRANILDARKSLERGYQSKFDDMADIRRNDEAIAQIMAPVEQQLNQQGLDRNAGIRMLVAAQQALQNNPAAALAQLVQQYGGANAQAILGQLNTHFGVTTPAPTGEVDEYVEPGMKQLQDQVSQLTGLVTQQQTNSQQAQQADINNQIQLFQEAKDDDGNPKFPHFDTLHTTMGGLMQAGIATSMEDAYERAARQDPAIFAEMMKDRDAKVVTDLDTHRKETNAKAKASSRDVPTNRSAPDTPNEVPKNMKECVTSVVDELMAQS